MNELHLFAGCAGGILGGMLLGHTCVCAVEINPYRRKALLQRQRDGILPWFPIWDDVGTFDGRPWRRYVDAVCGGFPCKGVSLAGDGTGLDHEESGLWHHQARILGDILPRYAFIENTPMLTSRGGIRVISDLAQMGYNCVWGIVSARDAIWACGAPALDHLRERIWILGKLANPHLGGCAQTPDQRIVEGGEERADPSSGGRNRVPGCHPGWWTTEPGLGRVVNGLAHRVDRIEAIGDAQVPAVAALAWQLLEPLLP